MTSKVRSFSQVGVAAAVVMLRLVIGEVSIASAAILHVDVNGIPVTGPPTLDIVDISGNVIQNWLPEPGQQPVTLRVLGATVNGAMTLSNTSNYPGICTNYGTDTGPDFALNGTQLTSNDCGGTTQLTVSTNLGTFTFRLPQDSDNDGIPDVWETQYGDRTAIGNLTANADTELNPSVNAQTDPQGGAAYQGDGIAAFDEYRGFLVSLADTVAGVPYNVTPILPNTTKHIRTNPAIKDIFVHVVNNQCAPASPPAGRFSQYFPGSNNSDLFAFTYSLLPGTQIHLLDYAPGTNNPVKSVLWEDFFEYYAVSPPSGQTLFNVVYRTAANALTNAESSVATDRQINKNARYPIIDTLVAARIASGQLNANYNSNVQKGVRVVECQIVQTSGNLGINDWGTPNTPGDVSAIRAGNAIVFPERLRSQIVAKLKLAQSRQILWGKFIVIAGVGTWPPQSPPDLASNTLSGAVYTPNDTTVTFLTTRQLQYIVGHEVAHSALLRPTSQNGYHTCTGCGSMMDATYQVTQDASKTQFNIPVEFPDSDRKEIKERN